MKDLKFWQYILLTPFLYLLIEILIVEFKWGLISSSKDVGVLGILIFFGVIPVGCSLIMASLIDYAQMHRKVKG